MTWTGEPSHHKIVLQERVKICIFKIILPTSSHKILKTEEVNHIEPCKKIKYSTEKYMKQVS